MAAQERARELQDTAGRFVAADADATYMQRACFKVACYAADGVPKGTAAHNRWGFKWVVTVCLKRRWFWMRPKYVPPERHCDEDAFCALLLGEIAPLMSPSPRAAAAGIQQAQPPSALYAIYAYLRVMHLCGRHVADTRRVAQSVKGMTEEFKRTWGLTSCAVKHHQPIPRAHLLACVRALRSYQMSCLGWSRAKQDGFCALLCYGANRAPRMNEVPDYKRSNFGFALSRTKFVSTTAFSSDGHVPDGTLLRAVQVPSKTDRSGKKWCGKHLFYRVDSGQELSFAAEWARYEAKYPCPKHEETFWPAFSPTGGRQAFSETEARSSFAQLMQHAVGHDADGTTWHDLRATIAAAIVGSNKPKAVAQALVNWASVDSVELYGQMHPHQMADYAAGVVATDASRHAHLPRPHMDADTVLAELESCAFHLEGKADNPRTSTKPESDSRADSPAPAAPTSAAPRKRALWPDGAKTNTKTARRAASTPPGCARPAKGAKVEVFWSEEGKWFTATVGPTRRADGATCLLYDAHDGFTAVRDRTFFHVLATEQWRLAA